MLGVLQITVRTLANAALPSLTDLILGAAIPTENTPNIIPKKTEITSPAAYTLSPPSFEILS